MTAPDLPPTAEERYDLATDDATLHAVEVEVTVPPAMSSESARAITDSLAVRLDQFLHSGHYPEHLRALSEAIDALRAISEATVPPVVTPLPYPYCHVCFARDRRYTLAMRTRDGSPMCDLHWQEDQSAPVVPRAYRVAAQIVETLDDACNGETLTKDGSLAYSAAYQHDNTRLSIRAALHVARERAEASVTEDGT